MKYLFLIFIVIFAISGASAQENISRNLTLTEEIKLSITAYHKCLHKVLFSKSSREENQNRIISETLASCSSERNAIMQLDIDQGLPLSIAKEIDRELNKDVRADLRERLDRVAKEYLDALSISHGVYENCAMANRPGAVAFYEGALNNMATDFAYYRKRSNRERDLAKANKEVKAKIIKLGPEAWCKEIWDQTEGDAKARNKLFVE